MALKMSKDAARVAAYIRNNVPYPGTLPRKLAGGLRWHADEPGCKFGHEYCPMGLLPSALVDTPITSFTDGDMPPGGGRATNSFADWWDSQRNAKAAVKAVWG